MGNAVGLSPQWQDWIAENLSRGCREADMVGVMVANGFAAEFAGTAVAIFRDMRARLPAEGMGASYEAPPLRLAATGEVECGGRKVGIGFTKRDPNIALIEDILSPDECKVLIDASRDKLQRSRVVNRATGGFDVDAVRTSEGTHFARGENPTVAALEARIAALTGLPIENGEPLQILHYDVGGEYLAHHDYFDPADAGSAVHLEAGGQRIATLVIYLNTVPLGGETRFPRLDLAVRARQGNAVYFEYHDAKGNLDARCLHAGVPVAEGEKWIATKWLRQGAYVRPPSKAPS